MSLEILKNEQSARQVLVVLGVHRSGTSLTAQVLNALGVRFGDKLIPGRSDNPAGFFEHREILEQTRRLERKLDLAPFRNGASVPWRSDWWKDSSIDEEKAALKQILFNETENTETIFGFKDPRTLFLLPLWQEIFSELDLTPRYVLALRNLADVAASMGRRGTGRIRAEMIWAGQMAAGIKYLPQSVDAVVRYECWFNDPQHQGIALARALNLTTGRDDQDLADRIRQVIQPDLRHYGTSVEQAYDFALPPVKQFHEALDRFVDGKADWEAVQTEAEQICNFSRLLAPLMQEMGQLPERLERELESARDKVRSLQDKINLVSMDSVAPDGARPVEKVAPRYKDPYKAVFPRLASIRAPGSTPGRYLKVCIATEDIVGPIRNGGIGTTYTHLALLLAEAGHDTTILYLRGSHCENQNIDYWLEWYKQRGVAFIPIKPATDIVSPADRWTGPMVALYRYLQQNRYDMVHVSEWRGSACLCLLAKKQGLAFQDTIFCVKSSSPWLWNCEAQLGPLDQVSDLVKIYAERLSVELADLVVGGSAYLLRWMLAHGYHLPAGRTFVQPNVIKPVNIPAELLRNRPLPGNRVPVSEIVFFGRLEHRKGLDIFCDAISDLVSEGVSLPPVTFMGKFGARIPGYEEMTVEAYIHEKAGQWPMPWKILSDYNQIEALTYLHGPGRLAVIASVIENSPLTVYEATHFGIPFIATDVGGAAELIKREHQEAVLTHPHPVPLADKIREALAQGGMVAAPSFDNSQNLGQWLNFHSQMSVIIDQKAWPSTSIPKEDVKRPDKAGRGQLPRTSVCLVVNDDNREHISSILTFLLEAVQGDFEVLLVDDGSAGSKTYHWIRHLQGHPDMQTGKLRVFRCRRFGLAAARNFGAQQAAGDFILFIDPGAMPRAEVVKVLASAAAHSDSDVLIPIYNEKDNNRDGHPGKTVFFLAGDPSFSFYDPFWRGAMLYVRKTVFDSLGGFPTDYKTAGAVEEFLAGAVLSGKRVETLPMALADVSFVCNDLERSAPNMLMMRILRPYVDATSLYYQPLLMYARSCAQPQMIGLRSDKEASRPASLGTQDPTPIIREQQIAQKGRKGAWHKDPVTFLRWCFVRGEQRSPRQLLWVFKAVRILTGRYH